MSNHEQAFATRPGRIVSAFYPSFGGFAIGVIMQAEPTWKFVGVLAVYVGLILCRRPV